MRQTCDKCGRMLKLYRNWGGEVINKTCPKHGDDYIGMEEKKQKIGKWSGKSRSQNAFNDYKE